MGVLETRAPHEICRFLFGSVEIHNFSVGPTVLYS